MAEREHYELIIKPSVERDLRRLPVTIVARVLERLDALARDPLPRGVTKLAGAEQLFRVRVGEYRVVYGFEPDDRRITVFYVRHRRDANRDI